MELYECCDLAVILHNSTSYESTSALEPVAYSGNKAQFRTLSNQGSTAVHNMLKLNRREAATMGYAGGTGAGGGYGGGLTSTGVILVLFILLVIISRAFI